MTDKKTLSKTSAVVGADAPAGYDEFLRDVKAQVRSAQIRAALAVNSELVALYWQIGADISARMSERGWGAKVVDRLSADLRREFPTQKGFSPRNLRYMRSFAEAWPDKTILQRVVAKLPWGQNVTLLDKLNTTERRLWYADQSLEHGWGRDMLVHQIESNLYARQGKAVTNFERALPPAQSDLARQLLKDPYNFDFLTLGQDAQERELEQGLIEHIRKFLLELGAGFAFLGSQYPLEFDDEDYYLDLLFYHVKLRCYVVIELKTGKFLPEYAGKMNFYLAVVDDVLRHQDDAPTIGLILCKDKKALTVEYALGNVNTPIGVSAYQLTESLPEELKTSLPSVEQLEEEFAGMSGEAEGDQDE